MNRNGKSNRGPQLVPRQQQTQINPNDLPSIECKCGNDIFVMAMQLRYANRLVSANGQPTVVQVPQGWVCSICGKANDFAYKPEIEDIIPKPIETEEEGE